MDEIDGVGDGGGGIGLLGVEQEAGQADQVTGSTEKGEYTIVLTNTKNDTIYDLTTKSNFKTGNN